MRNENEKIKLIFCPTLVPAKKNENTQDAKGFFFSSIIE